MAVSRTAPLQLLLEGAPREVGGRRGIGFYRAEFNGDISGGTATQEITIPIQAQKVILVLIRSLHIGHGSLSTTPDYEVLVGAEEGGPSGGIPIMGGVLPLASAGAYYNAKVVHLTAPYLWIPPARPASAMFLTARWHNNVAYAFYLTVVCEIFDRSGLRAGEGPLIRW